MSTHTSMSDTEHQALQDLLPWYASGSLGEAEALRVQEHLQGCAACREDLSWQRKLLVTEGPLPSGLDPERALARLMPQLDAVPQQPAARVNRATPLARLRAWLGDTGWQGWAIAAQLGVIAVLAVQLLPHGGEAPPAYQALGRGAASTPDVLVVFKADARLQDVQQLLQASGAQIIGGPTVTGAYMLDVDAGHRAELLSALRANPAVELAESLTAAGQP
ncbi:anti-sigma factor RsiW [Duganella sp. SG902]|uniref:zf-HC2 domain-containing protein n=1 Tax=Duganella sp. SG902 TaxID=2587016 RepID=UPI00159DD441|nr:zf-HC2 domain-containing protein [Duganella sp. SG902]NVM75650.1 anti-sigma factor RsiW [Duganella sp. SG902]